ncbi:unnamed protein product, partial [Polarella glacialis]
NNNHFCGGSPHISPRRGAIVGRHIHTHIPSLRTDIMLDAGNSTMSMSATGFSLTGGSSLSSSKGFRDKHKEPPSGSFGQGGWSPGGGGKYPRQTSAECEKTRLKFRRLILKRFPTVIAGWQDMDKNVDGRLSFFEFMRACQKLGVDQSARQIWAALDIDRSGFVSLSEIDPALAELVGKLAVTIWRVFGSVDKAWRQHFNKKGKLRISADEFAQAAHEIEFQGDPYLLFNELSTNKATTGINRQ